MGAEEQATRLAKLPDRIAAIVGKTYGEIGDQFDPENPGHLADNDALVLITDLLHDIDPKLIERNKAKRLIRR